MASSTLSLFKCTTCGTFLLTRDLILSHIQQFHTFTTTAAQQREYENETSETGLWLLVKFPESKVVLKSLREEIGDELSDEDEEDIDENYSGNEDEDNVAAMMDLLSTSDEEEEIDKEEQEQMLRPSEWHSSRFSRSKRLRIMSLKNAEETDEVEESGEESSCYEEYDIMDESSGDEYALKPKKSSTTARKKRKRSVKIQENDISANFVSDTICPVCLMEFSEKKNMLRHVKHTHPNQTDIYPCEECGKRFERDFHLKLHQKIEHSKKDDGSKKKIKNLPEGDQNFTFLKDEFKCYDCPEIFRTQEELYAHRKIHRENISYKCSDCLKTFKIETQYKMHMLQHSDQWEELKKNPKLLKEERKKIINERKRFRYAIYNRPLKYKCIHCPRAFHCRAHQKRHILSHNNERPHRCETCGSSYRVEFSLRQHLQQNKCEKVLSEIAARQYTCDICGIGLISQKSLQGHKRRMHGISQTRERLEMSCPFCNYRTRVSSTLRRHMRTHMGDKPFKCEACSSPFAFHTNMIAHMRLHCEEARKLGISNKYPKKERILSKHPRPKPKCPPVTCPICSEVFLTPGRFKCHQSIHGTEHICPHCSAGYQTMMGLGMHMKRIHPQECNLKEKCDNCHRAYDTPYKLRLHYLNVHGMKIAGPGRGRKRNSLGRQAKNHQRKYCDDDLDMEDLLTTTVERDQVKIKPEPEEINHNDPLLDDDGNNVVENIMMFIDANVDDNDGDAVTDGFKLET